jgi:S-adenosylmethionine decarboxylase
VLTPPVLDPRSDRLSATAGPRLHPGGPFRDLAPEIHRQRLVVEGLVSAPIVEHEIVGYLKGLGSITDMTVLAEPVTNRSPLYGWAAWVHWETSGAHFYAWDAPHLFFSVDMYTCKAFAPSPVVEFTQEYFSATEIQSHGF